MGTTSSIPKLRRATKLSTKQRRKIPDAVKTIRSLELRVLRLGTAVEALIIKREVLGKERALLTRRDSAEFARRKVTNERLVMQLRILETREQERLNRAMTRFTLIKRRLNETPYFLMTWKQNFLVISNQKVYFSAIRKEDVLSNRDKSRFEKAQRVYEAAETALAVARKRHQSLCLLIEFGPEDVPSHTSLPTSILNLIATRDSLNKSPTRPKLRAVERRLNDIDNKISQKQTEVSELSNEINRLETGLTHNRNSVASPPSRLLMQWSDAEALALEYCQWLGYQRAKLTNEGSDGGVDIEGQNLVVQVKMHNRPTGRPEIQQLYGIAASDSKRALFFAMSYSSEAREWADRVGVRLYQFLRDGTVQPIGLAAKSDLITGI